MADQHARPQTRRLFAGFCAVCSQRGPFVNYLQPDFKLSAPGSKIEPGGTYLCFLRGLIYLPAFLAGDLKTLSPIFMGIFDIINAVTVRICGLFIAVWRFI